MYRLLSALNQFLGSLLTLAIVTLLGAGGWVGYQTYYTGKWALRQAEERLAQRESEITGLQQKLGQREQEIERLGEDLQAKQKEVERLDTALRLLKVDHRIARFDVLSQTGSAEKGDLATKFRFVEVDDKDRPMDTARDYTVKGDLVYLDAWVIKFNDQLVESGDPLRSTSVCLFKRIFGENQQPKDGFVIDSVGRSPIPYRGTAKVSPWEQELWDRFWDYANDPGLASRAGIRSAHGEAPSIKLTPGKRYRVLLRASGGLSIEVEEVKGGKLG